MVDSQLSAEFSPPDKNMLEKQVIAPPGQYVTEDEIINTLTRALEKQFTKQRVLILIPITPDHYRYLSCSGHWSISWPILPSLILWLRLERILRFQKKI